VQEQIPDIAVQETDNAQAKQDEQQSLQNLEGADGDQPAIAAIPGSPIPGSPIPGSPIPGPPVPSPAMLHL
jgi:hypothetical protein